MESDNKVELREVVRLPCLSLDQHLVRCGSHLRMKVHGVGSDMHRV